MISMHGNHPDVIEFINSKQDLTKVTGANISVQFTDEFMKAVENDSEFILRWPVDTKVEDIPGVENLPMNEKVWLNDSRLCVKRMKARDIWNTFIHCSWNTVSLECYLSTGITTTLLIRYTLIIKELRQIRVVQFHNFASRKKSRELLEAC